MDQTLIEQSCRVALAAYLHDLGKFAERAGAFDRDPRLDAHLTLYCPMVRLAKADGSRTAMPQIRLSFST